MAATITIPLIQVGRATTEATIRDHRTLIDRPEAKGGDDRGPMGGELLLASLGGCFASNLLAAIRAREDVAIDDARVEIAGTLDGTPPRFTRVEIRVAADHQNRAELEKLVAIAERGCIVANTLKDAVELSVRVGD